MKRIIIICLLFCSYIVMAFSPLTEDQNLANNKENFGKLTAEQSKALEEHRALEIKYNVKRGNRPPIDLDKVPQDAYEKGKLQIKLMPFMHKNMDSEILSADKESGFVKTGISSLDEVNEAINATQYLRRQDALYRVSPASVKHKERHEAWGSHLWREISFDSKIDVIEAVKMFQSLTEVEIAEPIYIKRIIEPVETKPVLKGNGEKWTPNDPYYALNQWHFNNTGQDIGGQIGTTGWDCNAEAAWDIETGNPNFIVAIIDQGVDYVHEDIADNMWPTIGPEGTGTAAGDHGTHVAGTISAVSNNGVGVPGLSGGDGSGNGSLIMSIDLWGGTGMTTLQMNQYAADNGASISQNSWGYGSAGYYDQSDLDGIDYFNANGGGDGLIGGITIFAAGNDNDNGQWYPAYYGYGDAGTMGAMAVASHDNQGTKSDFSNYGAWIDITAPGTNVASLAPSNGYVFMSGTSMACPHVSGVAAMIVSNTEGILTNEELWDIIVNSVRTDLYDVNPGYTGELGIGALDAAAALEEAQTYLGGVPTADNFQAVGVAEDQIDLSWTLNEHNDDVLIAWALQGDDIGAPVDGTDYSVGNAIPGGGTVLYNGNAASTSHTSLTSATGYSYKIWAKAAEDRPDDQGEWYMQGDYSAGKNATAQTDCGIVNILPFEEIFDTATLPLCWENIDHEGSGQVWQFGTHANGLSGTTGNYAYLDSDAYGSGNTQNTDLITPTIDLTNYTDISLSFTHYYRHYDAETATVSYSVDNGATWTQIQQWAATTANPVSFSETIAALAGESQVKFKWNYTGSWGYYWDIDDISLTGTFSNSVLLGDVNDDAVINVLDIVWLVNYILGDPHIDFVEEAADVNEDTFIDISDVAAISNLIMGGAKNSNSADSETAYVFVEDGKLKLESDGTLVGLQFEIIADNADGIDLNLLSDDYRFAYTVNDNVITGLVYSYDNNLFAEGTTDILNINNLGSFNWGHLIAANYNAERVELLPKDASFTNEFEVSNVNVDLYPNPNSGNFTLAVELPSEALLDMQLFDVTGRKVMDIQPTAYSKGINQIEVNNTHNLERGFYILRVNGFNLNNNNLLFRNEVKVMIEK